MFSRKSSTGCYVAPHPNPAKFEILKLLSIDGKHTLVLIKYDGCTTFNGEKIAIYKAAPEIILAAKELDPHFLENELSPIARFPASFEGEFYAMNFLKTLL